MDLSLYSCTPPLGLNDSLGSPSDLTSDSGIALSTPRYFAPKGTSIDCRNLPRTSDLVAKFEKNIQEYHSRKEIKSSSVRVRSSSKCTYPARTESFSLRQRQILYSPRSDNETESIRSRREVKLRLRQDKPAEPFDLESKRASCGLRIACPTAKSALFSGANRPCVSPFSLQTDSILSSPRSQFLEVSTAESDIESSSENNKLQQRTKPPRMSPITIVTSASNSHIPNMIMANAAKPRVINSNSSMQKCYYSSTDSGAETMTSFSNYDSHQSTPNTFPINHSVADFSTNERIANLTANQNGLSRPVSLLTTESEVIESSEPKTFRSSVTCSYSAKKVLSSSSDVIENGHGDSELKTSKSSLKTPTKIIRKTKLSNFAFCGLSKSCTKTTKVRDPYIPSPSQAPSTPITTPHRIHKVTGDFETSKLHSQEVLSSPVHTSRSLHSPVRVRVSAPESELKYPKSVPPKKPIRASLIRPVRFSFCEDQNDAEPESAHSGVTNAVPVDNLSFTTGDEECELSSLAESFSSRDFHQEQCRSTAPVLHSMPPPLSLGVNSSSASHKQNNKSLLSSLPSQPANRPLSLPPSSNAMTPSVEVTPHANLANSPQTATLIPNGVVLDEETFQRTMKDLNEMKVLLGTLMKSLQSNPLPNHCDSPLEEGLREDIYRRFTAQIRATLYQDASTQTTTNDDEIPQPEADGLSCNDSPTGA